MLAQRTTKLIYLLGGIFLFLDQFLKLQSTGAWNKAVLWKNVLGWQPFLNKGVAFGIPLPNLLVIVLSILIIAVLISRITYNLSRIQNDGTGYMLRVAGYLLIIAGALSNLYDRIVFKHTIDYLRIFTSVINLADVMIVVGFVLLLLGSKYHSSNKVCNINL